MLVILMINGLISVACWTVAVKLSSCRSKIITTTVFLEKATTACEQLQFVPLGLAAQQLQILQLRQIYQQQSGQVNQLRQFMQLLVWLDLIALD